MRRGTMPGARLPGARLPGARLPGARPRGSRLMDLLRALLYGVSAQRPSHSLYIAGEQLPLEARMGGIFLGFLGALVVLAVVGRLRACQPPGDSAALAAWGLIALMALDGLNAVLFDGGLPHAYPPNTVPRLLTGLGAGYSLAVLAMPVAASIIWRAPEDEAPMGDAADFGAGLALVALFGLTLLADVWLLLWPAAVAMLLSVLAGFGLGNQYLLALVEWRRECTGGPPSSAPMRGSPVAALGLALLEIALLAALRSWMASQGATWGI